MKLLARIICNRLWATTIVLVVMVAAGASLYMARQVQHEDDILAFLPKENPEVKLFHEINSRFGGLDLALVGIRTDDPVDPAFIKKLRKTTLALKQTHGLDHVLSLANIMDFTPDTEKGGIITDRLVNSIPKNKAERDALYRKVMSRDHVVGNLVSADGKATDLTFTVAKADLDRAVETVEARKDDLNYVDLLSDSNVVKISVIGVGMRSHEIGRAHV